VDLSFFNCVVRINSSNSHLRKRISYIFKNFLINDSKPDVYFQVEPKTDNSELTSSSEEFEILFSYDGKSYSHWNYKDTFLPPLRISPLSGKYIVLHGCATRMNERTSVFLAPSMAGKTSLLMALINSGHKAISDDLLFIDVSSMELMIYKKPVGIRETGLNLFPDLKYKLESNFSNDVPLFYNTNGKKTWLIHLEDIYDKNVYFDRPSKVDFIFLPNQLAHGNSKKISSFEMYSTIFNSVCESGLEKGTIADFVFLLLKNSKHYLPTADLNKACVEVNKIVQE
jgi:hypothetical protein